jgi:hypothetical protein
MLYKTKPVRIQAVQWTGNNIHAIKDFTGDNTNFMFGGDLTINTLEGVMTAAVGDYIIRGLRGEFYPCKPDVFVQKYEPCENVHEKEE